jgi:hypothetical protein
MSELSLVELKNHRYLIFWKMEDSVCGGSILKFCPFCRAAKWQQQDATNDDIAIHR